VLEQDPSILITDDDSSFRETLGGIFEPLGFRTLMAADGVEALEVMQRESVHLLLLDMHMPRLTGLETLRQLRAWDISTPCIMLSAELDDAIRDAARRAKAFDVLGKPISRQDITDAVARAFREAYDWE
jgi:CheY-like chemotaxis protein